MTVTLDKTYTVSDLGNLVAGYIEREGHFQGQSDASQHCCVFVNPVFGQYTDTTHLSGMERLVGPYEWNKFAFALANKVGLPYTDESDVSGRIFDWNDNTDTQTVLDTLRSL